MCGCYIPAPQGVVQEEPVGKSLAKSTARVSAVARAAAAAAAAGASLPSWQTTLGHGTIYSTRGECASRYVRRQRRRPGIMHDGAPLLPPLLSWFDAPSRRFGGSARATGYRCCRGAAAAAASLVGRRAHAAALAGARAREGAAAAAAALVAQRTPPLRWALAHHGAPLLPMLPSCLNAPTPPFR